MGALASVVFALSTGSISPRPGLERPPPPPLPFEWGCIIFPDDEVVPACPDQFPGLPPLELLDPCPDRLDEIVADAEGVAP